MRLMAPGTAKIGDYFEKIFETAEANPESGLLGRCGPLLDCGGEGGNGMFTISYWKNQDLLKAWHQGPAHSEGMKWYYGHRSKYPHLGESIFRISSLILANGNQDSCTRYTIVQLGALRMCISISDLLDLEKRNGWWMENRSQQLSAEVRRGARVNNDILDRLARLGKYSKPFITYRNEYMLSCRFNKAYGYPHIGRQTM